MSYTGAVHTRYMSTMHEDDMENSRITSREEYLSEAVRTSEEDLEYLSMGDATSYIIHVQFAVRNCSLLLKHTEKNSMSFVSVSRSAVAESLSRTASRM